MIFQKNNSGNINNLKDLFLSPFFSLVKDPNYLNVFLGFGVLSFVGDFVLHLFFGGIFDSASTWSLLRVPTAYIFIFWSLFLHAWQLVSIYSLFSGQKAHNLGSFLQEGLNKIKKIFNLRIELIKTTKNISIAIGISLLLFLIFGHFLIGAVFVGCLLYRFFLITDNYIFSLYHIFKNGKSAEGAISQSRQDSNEKHVFLYILAMVSILIVGSFFIEVFLYSLGISGFWILKVLADSFLGQILLTAIFSKFLLGLYEYLKNK